MRWAPHSASSANCETPDTKAGQARGEKKRDAESEKEKGKESVAISLFYQLYNCPFLIFVPLDLSSSLFFFIFIEG